MIQIVPARESHIHLLADRLLEKERICKFFPLWSTTDIMKLNLKMSSESFTAFLDGEAACMYGVHTPDLISGKAMPWMMATDTVKKAKVAFYRMSKKYVLDMATRYSCLTGHVDSGFDKSQAWLKWLGFDIKEGEGFHTFKLDGYV